jgi:hypothetical protein
MDGTSLATGSQDERSNVFRLKGRNEDKVPPGHEDRAVAIRVVREQAPNHPRMCQSNSRYV